MKKTCQQKAQEHGCDGMCYWNTGMCPRVEYCEETRKREFRATVLAVLTIVGVPVVVIAGLVIVFLK